MFSSNYSTVSSSTFGDDHKSDSNNEKETPFPCRNDQEEEDYFRLDDDSSDEEYWEDWEKDNDTSMIWMREDAKNWIKKYEDRKSRGETTSEIQDDLYKDQWRTLSDDPHCIDLMKKNPEKINWVYFARLPNLCDFFEDKKTFLDFAFDEFTTEYLLDMAECGLDPRLGKLFLDNFDELCNNHPHFERIFRVAAANKYLVTVFENNPHLLVTIRGIKEYIKVSSSRSHRYKLKKLIDNLSSK